MPSPGKTILALVMAIIMSGKYIAGIQDLDFSLNDNQALD